MKITRNMKDPESRAFWRDIDRVAGQAHMMPPWQKPPSLHTEEEKAWLFLEDVLQQMPEHTLLAPYRKITQRTIKRLKAEHKRKKPR